MPNRHYEQGTRFEHKVQADLESRGYVTIRAAGSKGAGKVDIVAALPPDFVQELPLPYLLGRATPGHLWIQCKRTGLIAPGEWNRLRECAGWAGAVPVLAQNAPTGRGVTYMRLDADKVSGSRERPYSAYDVGPVRLPVQDPAPA